MVFVDFLGAVKGGLDVGHDVFAADVIEEARLQKELRGLLHRSAEQERAARGVKASGECLDGVNAGGVDGRHVAQAQNDDGREGFKVGRCLDKFLCSSEEKRAVDAEQRDIGRQDAALEGVGQTVANVVVGYRRDGGGFGNAVDVDQRGERHSNADGDREIGEDGERESDQPDGD